MDDADLLWALADELDTACGGLWRSVMAEELRDRSHVLQFGWPSDTRPIGQCPFCGRTTRGDLETVIRRRRCGAYCGCRPSTTD
jgi:hypothetical protein